MPNDVINTVTVNGTAYGIGGGGHTIKNPAGTAMTQRSNLQFVDLTVSDDSTNDVTKVENIHVIQSESELDNLPDGLYMLNEDEGTVLDASAVGYDNTDSGLEADNVQDAIDEVVDTLDDKIDISTKGVANGVAELDSTGKVPSSQLPSFVDDVIEVADYNHLPATGETGKIYVALDTNKTYRWGGTEYVEISESLALGETSSTAYRGDRGKTAYDHSQLTSGNPHNVTKSDIGLGNVDNTSDSTKKTNFTGSIASGNTGFVTGGDAYTALNTKADKVSSATNGNLAGLNGSGNLTDSGWNGAKDTTSISGNPISISGLKSNQLAVNPIITLEPIQAGSGAPSPSNVRAISGYDKVEVLSCGKNLCDNSQITKGIYYDGSGSAVSDAGKATSSLIRVKPNTNYRAHIYTKAGVAIQDMVWTLWSDETTCEGQSLNGYITTGANTKFVRIRNYSSEDSYIQNNNFLFALEEGQTSSTTYPEYVKATSISESLGQTVYWGELDVRNGKFKVLGIGYDMGDLSYEYASVGGHSRFRVAVTVAEKPSGFAMTSIYQTLTTHSSSYVSDLSIDTSGSTDSNSRIWIWDDRYTDTTSFKTAVTGQTIVYELKTPTIIQLTPREISLLKDYAYVSTNGTNIQFDYHNGELASLSDVAQVGETVNEGLDYLKDYVEANYRGGNIDISGYSGSNKYTIPNDGYINVDSQSSTSGYIRVVVQDSANHNLAFCYMNVTAAYQIQSVFVKKGMIAYVQGNTASNAGITYVPLV